MDEKQSEIDNDITRYSTLQGDWENVISIQQIFLNKFFSTFK